MGEEEKESQARVTIASCCRVRSQDDALGCGR